VFDSVHWRCVPIRRVQDSRVLRKQPHEHLQSEPIALGRDPGEALHHHLWAHSSDHAIFAGEAHEEAGIQNIKRKLTILRRGIPGLSAAAGINQYSSGAPTLTGKLSIRISHGSGGLAGPYLLQREGHLSDMPENRAVNSGQKGRARAEAKSRATN